MSAQDIHAAVTAAGTEIDQAVAQFGLAKTTLEQAHAAIAGVTEGSSNPDLLSALSGLQSAADLADEAAQSAQTAKQASETYANQV